MDQYIILENSNGSLLFRLFYLTAFLVAYGILIYEGYKRKFPLLTWILIIACVRLFLVSGSKLLAYSPAEWQTMIECHTLLPGTKKTLIGGLVMGLAGYLISSSWFRFRYNALDAMAVALPLGASIQKIGCFFAGCCFGNPSDLPWAVQYPVFSLAHYHHYQAGLITMSDPHSLPVHPVQLYFALGGFLVACLVIVSRNRWKASGSSMIISLILYAVIRFILEFFRDPLSNRAAGELFLHMKLVQWQLLIFTVISLIILVFREKRAITPPPERVQTNPSVQLSLTFVFFLVALFWLLRKLYTPTEIIALNLALVPAIILLVFRIFNSSPLLQSRWIYAATMLLPVLLMGQTLAQPAKDTSGQRFFDRHFTVSSGFAAGEFVNSHTIGQGDGCDRVENTEYFNQWYRQMAAGFSVSEVSTDKLATTQYGLHTYYGRYQQTRLSDGELDQTRIFGLNPYILYDRKWIGLGTGLHLGNLIYAKENKNIEGTEYPKSGNLHTIIFPQLYFRVGIKRFFYGEFNIADQFPSSSPGMRYQLGMGTAFGIKNGLDLRIGTTMLTEDGFATSYYVSGYFPVGRQLAIEPLYYWGQKPGNYSSFYGSSPQYQFMVGVHYNFGQKKITRPPRP